MRAKFLSYLLTALITLVATNSLASSVEMYVFGDSLSDGGNLLPLTGGLVPPTPPYAGVFSNGPVWVDQFADRLGLTTTNAYAASPGFDTFGGNITNFAVGGAYTGPQPFNFSNTVFPSSNAFDAIAGAPLLPGLQGPPALLSGLSSQVDFFRTLTGGTASPDAWYTIWAGANDFIFADLVEPAGTVTAVDLAIPAVENTRLTIAELASMGAKEFLVFNLPDIGMTPFGVLTGRSGELSAATLLYNNELEVMLENARQTYGIEIVMLDVNALFRDLLLAAAIDPSAAGFPDADALFAPLPGLAFCVDDSDPINRVDAFCEPTNRDPNDRIFWDSVHPTSAVHTIIASAVYDAKIPEPPMLFVFAACFLALYFAKRRQTA